MINYTWTDEDVKLVEKFIELKNKGYYADGAQLTQIYNRVLNKRVNPTNCGSCIRQRIMELESALNHFKELTKRQEELKAQEALKDAQVDNSSSDENKEVVEEKKRPGRPPKKSE